MDCPEGDATFTVADGGLIGIAVEGLEPGDQVVALIEPVEDR